MPASREQTPIGFALHATSCLAAAAIGATSFTLVYLVQCAWAGKMALGLAFTPVLWTSALLIALISGGFWLTLVWPVTRRIGSASILIAPLAVAAGAIIANGGAAIALGKPASAFNLVVFAVLGAVTGLAYCRAIRRI